MSRSSRRGGTRAAWRRNGDASGALHPRASGDRGQILIQDRPPASDAFWYLRRDPYRAAGIDADFVQENHSRSVCGTIRALHFQADPGQPKLVRVARGRAWDVVVDIRRSSPTFGEWESFELDDERNLQLYVPIGFAHGFCALSEVVDLVYKVDSYYDPATDRGIAWDDHGLKIPWPTDEPIISERDRSNPTLAQITDELPAW